MNDLDEASYLEGQRAVWRQLLSTCLDRLGGESPDGARAVARLHDARVAVRSLLNDFGVEDPSELHLDDVVEKRLRPAIERLQGERDRARESVRSGPERPKQWDSIAAAINSYIPNGRAYDEERFGLQRWLNAAGNALKDQEKLRGALKEALEFTQVNGRLEAADDVRINELWKLVSE